MFSHTVLFWLRSDAPTSIAADMQNDCRDILAKLPSVRHLWVGIPANTPRPVVDNSYSVGLTVIYDDAAGHDAYQVHELHTAFSAKFKPYWARVQVYDFA